MIDDELPAALPERLPVLPLRDTVTYPDTLTPLAVGQDRSIQLVNDVLSGDRMLVMLGSKDPDLDTPGPDQLHSVGVAGIVARSLPDTRWVIAKSDYVSEDQIARVAREPDGRVIDGDDAELSCGDGRRVLRTAHGVEIELTTSADAMRRADVAVTIPGTNTAELAALGIPMLLLLPTLLILTLLEPHQQILSSPLLLSVDTLSFVIVSCHLHCS